MAKTYIHLINGDRFSGEAFGYPGESEGELVFSTTMTGYVESLTDPSFAGQILTFTYPLIGNYGVPKPELFDTHCMSNLESERIWVKGVLLEELCTTPSHFQHDISFSQWLAQQHIPGIAGIDTRMLTHIIREQGCMRAIISPEDHIDWSKKTADTTHWVGQSSCRQTITYKKSKKQKHVVVLDCGVKHGILRQLIAQDVMVSRIPWDADPLSLADIDGLVVSNGPGDPKDCPQTIHNIRRVLDAHIPYLGICLGHQLLGLAIGADTYKLPFGHRGINQPCQDIHTKKAYITSQNHGYAVDAKKLPAGFAEWFINLNDKTNEGLINAKKKVWSVQFHPEGQPGPFDSTWIFDMFIKNI